MSVLRSFAAPAAVALSLLLSLSGCGGGGGGGGGGGTGAVSVTPSSGATTGIVSGLVTDGASEKWSHIVLPVQKIVLKLSSDSTKSATVYDGGSNPAPVDFVTLDGVAQLLGQASVPTGSYDTVEVTVDTDSTHATLTDINGNTVASSKLRIDGGPTITLKLKSTLTVTTSTPSIVQVEFAIDDPTFITTAPDGTVVVHLVLKHKETPADPSQIELKEAEGKVSAVADHDFTITNEAGKSVTYKVDSKTTFIDAATKAAGTLSSIKVDSRVSVKARAESDGSYTAVRVTYASTSDQIKQAQVDTHIFSIDTVAKTIKTYDDKGKLTDIAYDSSTVVTFKGDTTAPLPLSALQPGFLIHVDVKDGVGTAGLKQATAIDVKRATDIGVLSAATASSLTLKKAYSNRGATPVSYTEKAGFKWWYEGHADTTSDSAALVTLLSGKGAGSDDDPQKGEVELTWDATHSVWNAVSMVVRGHEIEGGTITTPYSATTHTFTVTYSEDGHSKITTYTLTESGDTATKVISFTKSQGVASSTEVAADKWPTTLVTSVEKVNVSSVTQSDGTIAARTVSVYTGF